MRGFPWYPLTAAAAAAGSVACAAMRFSPWGDTPLGGVVCAAAGALLGACVFVGCALCALSDAIGRPGPGGAFRALGEAWGRMPVPSKAAAAASLALMCAAWGLLFSTVPGPLSPPVLWLSLSAASAALLVPVLPSV